MSEMHYDAGRGRSAHVAVERCPNGTRRFAFEAHDLKRTVQEQPGARFVETGSTLLDGLFALALEEVRENSIASINDVAFRHGGPLAIEAFETGELWHYVWTRDLAYAADLALASLDAPRCVRSLMYKTSGLKSSIANGDASEQILQDTGSGGSYPVSTDRVVWALAAARVVHFMSDAEQASWVARVLPILRATIEQDRALIFDPTTGLYRGEESFLDWREQTYPPRTRENVLEIAMSQSLSTNVTHFVILKTAADWSRRIDDAAHVERYDEWAEALRVAINERLWDEEAGLYSAYLLVDLAAPIRVRRYDLLGQSLAILCGVADRERARRAIASYPTGPHGPSVVWPQESTVPIYHNHAIWPFVTAYWARSAKHVGHESAVASALSSLVRGAALHLSNMENLDWASGEIFGESHGISGPTINSRRQLWSVAGFASVVQDVLFGMETTDGSIRFAPCVPVDVRRAFLGDSTSIRLRDVDYRGKRIDVTVTLPTGDAGRLRIGDVRLNGASIGETFVAWSTLGATNDWRIEMVADADSPADAVRTFDRFDDARAIFGPPTPAWRSSVGQGGLELVDGRITLHYEPVGDRDVLFNLYRDGTPVARHVTETHWTDAACDDCTGRAPEYRVEAVFPDSLHHSYPTDARRFDPMLPPEPPRRHEGVPCRADDVMLHVDVPHAGRYAMRLSYANPNGTINTGITCAIRRVSVAGDDGVDVASGYVIFPQTGGPQIFQRSSPLIATFAAAGRFAVRVGHDDRCRNMSYFAHNEHYTGHEGGGPLPHNEISLESARLTWLESPDAATKAR